MTQHRGADGSDLATLDRGPEAVADGTGAKRRTRPGRSHAERRLEAETRILKAAFDLVARRGVDQLTLAEAGEAAGYSRALAAHYFGDRETLLGAVAKRAVELYRERLTLKGGAAAGLEAVVLTASFHLDDIRNWSTRLRAFYELTNAALRWPSIAPVVAQLDQEAVAYIAHHIRTGQQQGEIHPDLDPQAEAVAIHGALRGIMTQWLVAPDQVDLDRVRDAYLASLRRALAVAA